MSASPLSWGEARSLLRQVLEDYLDDPPPVKKSDPAPPPANESLLSKAIRHDVDLYAGALALSVALLILASFSLSARVNGTSSLLMPTADVAVYRAEVAAAVLLVLGSLTGVWVVRRRRFLSLNDSDNAKRREIRKFLHSSASSPDDATLKQQAAASPLVLPEPELVNLTAQTGVYPVYRRSENGASWTRIPSLLLVRGDWIALQIGDVAPANCSVKNDDASQTIIQVSAGERLTMETFGYTAEGVTVDLPRGRSTLPNDATNHLLTLCNKMQIFTVVDTPLEKFIRKPSGKRVMMCLIASCAIRV